jgi:hypothetical protein
MKVFKSLKLLNLLLHLSLSIHFGLAIRSGTEVYSLESEGVNHERGSSDGTKIICNAYFSFVADKKD